MDYWTVAQKLIGQLVVVYMPDTDSWKGGYLIGMIPADDLFLIKWIKNGSSTTLPGIWRVHSRSLFTGTRKLPIARYPARLPQSNKQHPQGGRMATKKASGSKTPTKKATKKVADTNGAKKSTGRTRGPDKLEGLSDAKKRNIAKVIFRERSKSPATSWPDIIEMVQDKYDWTLPGSMTGRRLLREFGPDNAEEAIIQQNRADAAKAKAKGKAKAATKTKKRKVEPEDEPDDEDLEDEDEDEDEDIEDEADEDLEDDEDEDEDEDEEEEEPPAKAKKVRVTRGRGKKANPSK